MRWIACCCRASGFGWASTAAGASLGLTLRQMRYRMARLGVGAAETPAERGENA